MTPPWSRNEEGQGGVTLRPDSILCFALGVHSYLCGQKTAAKHLISSSWAGRKKCKSSLEENNFKPGL